MHLGLIGYGNIAAALIERLTPSQVRQVTALIRPASDAAERHAAQPLKGAPPVRFVTSLEALTDARPQLIVECAGHAALRDHGPALLRAGHDMVIASLGAQADEQFQQQMDTAAREGKARIILPSGAIGGLDLLRAVALSGKVEVSYTGRKPPLAWKGSPAEDVVDLDRLEEAATFFTGSGRQAALQYPKNANVVAALALAGAGFDTMRVALVADPTVQGNQHAYEVVSPLCRYQMQIDATGSAGNARTSATTVLSILQEITTYRATL